MSVPAFAATSAAKFTRASKLRSCPADTSTVAPVPAAPVPRPSMPPCAWVLPSDHTTTLPPAAPLLTSMTLSDSNVEDSVELIST